jgi:hypothetical protein
MPPTLVEIDVAPLLSAPPEDARNLACRAAIMTACSGGDIILLRNACTTTDPARFVTRAPTPADLCKVAPPVRRFVDGASSAGGEADLIYICSQMAVKPTVSDKSMRRFRAACFGGDHEAMNAYLDRFQEAENELRAIARRILHDYDYQRDWGIWRMNVKDHSVHLDPGPPILKSESIRLFANLDTEDRVWACGRSLPDMIASHPEVLERLAEDSRSADRNARYVLLAERLGEIARAEPMQRFVFGPGDVWAFDGRLVSHGVVSGRKSISLTVRMGTEIPRYHARLRPKVEAAEREALAAARPAHHRTPIRGYSDRIRSLKRFLASLGERAVARVRSR